MRLRLLVATLLLAGCTQPQAGPGPPNPVPPSLLVDRAANATLQVYVHAKQGNVRYDFLNLSVENMSAERRVEAYSLESLLPRPAAHLAVEVVEGDVTYAWAARFALNETADPPLLTVESYDGHDGGYAVGRDFALPYEKLLPREEAS